MLYLVHFDIGIPGMFNNHWILDVMREAEVFVGDHDFAAFRAQGCTAKSTFRTITRSEILLTEDDEVHFEVQGKGFLRHMVRIMTGSVVAVGLGKRRVPSHSGRSASFRSDSSWTDGTGTRTLVGLDIFT